MGLNIGEVINGMILIRNIRLKKKLGYDFCLSKKDKEFYLCIIYVVWIKCI